MRFERYIWFLMNRVEDSVGKAWFYQGNRKVRATHASPLLMKRGI